MFWDINKLQIGDLLQLDEGEVWRVVKTKYNAGLVVMVPYNEKAKNSHTSIAINFSLNYLDTWTLNVWRPRI